MKKAIRQLRIISVVSLLTSCFIFNFGINYIFKNDTAFFTTGDNFSGVKSIDMFWITVIIMGFLVTFSIFGVTAERVSFLKKKLKKSRVRIK